MGTQLIVALDAPFDRAGELYRALKPLGVAFKIGVPLLLEPWGRLLAAHIALDGQRLMLDLKLYDTRDTVRRTMEAVETLGAHMVTVHENAVEHTVWCRSAAAVLAVRGLTDGTGGPPAGRWDGHAFGKSSLADGIVCSAGQAKFIRPHTDKLLVCPGIRPAGTEADNHAQAATPAEARAAGADYIVVGRPIIDDPDPVGAARRIIDELSGGSST